MKSSPTRIQIDILPLVSMHLKMCSTVVTREVQTKISHTREGKGTWETELEKVLVRMWSNLNFYVPFMDI